MNKNLEDEFLNSLGLPGIKLSPDHKEVYFCQLSKDHNIRTAMLYSYVVYYLIVKENK